MSSSKMWPLTDKRINQSVVTARFAVRGSITKRAWEIKAALAEGDTSFPFSQVVSCNIGNPQLFDQQPLTYFRQVLAGVWLPESLQDSIKLPKEVMVTVKALHKIVNNGKPGAYSHSQGHIGLRKIVAKFIERRDGFAVDPVNLFFSDGASAGVHKLLQMLINSKKSTVLVPTPVYPLYTAAIHLYNGTSRGYLLDEANNWGLDIEEIKKSYKAALAEGLDVNSIVIINPGNPTGACLSKSNIEDVVEFCGQNKIVIIADEVYQENIYVDNKPFVSFKSVVMNSKYKNELQLVSYHSISKGFIGECGKRGGYMELYNISKSVREEFYKLAGVNLCSNIDGQLTTALMCMPPTKDMGDVYKLYEKEKGEILQKLKDKANYLNATLNKIRGIQCNNIEGAMYAFPQFYMPQECIDKCKKDGSKPDILFGMGVLNECGLCIVPGSGFGQREGSYHFRTTFLPSFEKMKDVYARFAKFYAKFLKDFHADEKKLDAWEKKYKN